MYIFNMSIKHNINFGLAGSVSVGKSTVLNALLWEYLGETKLKRTTCVPFKFINTNGKKNDMEIIKNQIIEINNDNCNEIKMKEFEIDFKWNKDSLYNCTIIDFPGLNDPHEIDNKMETVLFNYIENLDYLIYIIDSKVSLNNKYERNFIEKLFDNIKKCNTLTTLIILFNKYDEEDDEIDELINEAKNFINECSIKYEMTIPEMYKISGRKIMIKNIILKSQNQEIIPKNIREKVYKDYFGRNESNKMMQYDFIRLKEKINDISFTKEEYKFIYSFYEVFNDTSFYLKKLNDTKIKINSCITKNIHLSFSNYISEYEKYLKLNSLLECEDKINIIIENINYYMNNYYMNNYVCSFNKCKLIYSIIYNNVIEEDKKEYYFYPYFKKMIDYIFSLDLNKKKNNNFTDSLEFVSNLKSDKCILYVINKLFTEKIGTQDKIFILEPFTFCLYKEKIITFLINNYHLIKKNNALDILFDTCIYRYICTDIYNFSSFNYIYKIYINYVFYMLEPTQNIGANQQTLLELKFKFNTKKNTLNFNDIKYSNEYKNLNLLNDKINETSDIFKNFNKKYINYYPMDIITLYNYTF